MKIKDILGRIYFIYSFLLFVITMLIFFLPIWITSVQKEPARARLLHPIFKCWMSVFLTSVFIWVKRKGKQHFKKGDNYVVVINHNSLADIPISSPWIPGPNKTLAKIEMSRTPIFGVIYKAGSILVDRQAAGSRRESFSKMQEMLEKGIHLCLYPEGTRNKSDKPLQPFFDGAFIAAIKAQKAIIPGVLFNTSKVLPIDKKLYAWPHVIHFHFLEPVPTKGLTLSDTAQLKEKVHAIMENYYVTNLKTL